MCHEDCHDNGVVVESAAGFAARCMDSFGCILFHLLICFFLFLDKLFRSKGAVLRESLNEPVTIEGVRDNWGTILDMTDGDQPDSAEEGMGKFMEALRVQETGAALQNVTRSTLAGKRFPETKYKYNQNAAILYALGCENRYI